MDVDGTVLDAEESATSLRKAILDELGLNPAKAHDVVSFWREVALRAGFEPSEKLVEVAEQVFDLLDEDWIEDFEVDGRVMLVAYENLQAAIIRIQDEGATPFANHLDMEEEDEDDNRIARAGRVHTNRDTTTIGTLMGQIEDGSLILNPTWQREYVWTAGKKKKLIESVFLDIPIPTILLYEDAERRRHVIDGRQRLETLYRFRSDASQRLRFKTPGKSTYGWGEGEPLHGAAGKYFGGLPDSFKRSFQNYQIQTVTFTDLPKASLYEIFKRYNTGAESLRAQEIRNAVFQDSLLHQVMFRMAGEHQDPDLYLDDRERQVGEELRTVMGNKRRRYGAYNFVGRAMAFINQEGGTVASAINDLMEKWESNGGRPDEVELYRKQFLDAYEAVVDWYDEPFCTGREGKTQFHELVATIQLASAAKVLPSIRSGTLQEDSVRNIIRKEWRQFVYGKPDPETGELEGGVLQEKQNTSTHWGLQRTWTKKLMAAEPVGPGQVATNAQ